MFYGLSNKSDYFSKKVNMYSALAPCTSFDHSYSFILIGGSVLYEQLRDFMYNY